jgi:general secretion pathway protein A
MYHDHWGLSESPYRDRLDPRFFHQSLVQEEALARMHFLVDERRRIGLLLGGSGTGKSLLLGVFTRQLRRNGSTPAALDLLGLSRRELLWQIAAAWSLPVGHEADLFQLWRAVSDRMIEDRMQRRPSILLCDNADEASAEVLADIHRLSVGDASPENRTTIVLAARPEHVRRLGGRLLELAALRIDLSPWDAEETTAFVSQTLSQAGRKQPAFDAEALDRLYQLTRGVPRRVSQLADLALLAGAGTGLERIDAETVDAAWQELSPLGG